MLNILKKIHYLKHNGGNLHWKSEFLRLGLNRPGVLIETESGERFLVWDTNIFGCACYDCPEIQDADIVDDTIIKRYKVVWQALQRCVSCHFNSFYTLGDDECGAGGAFGYCLNGHWSGDGPESEEGYGHVSGDDPWADCEDCKATSEEVPIYRYP